MADFQATASETATKLTMLVEEIDQSQANLDALEQLVATTTSQIDTQWTELNTRAESLISQLNAIREQINAEVTEVGQTLNQLQEKITSAQSEIEQEFDETKASLDQLDSTLESVTSEQEEAWEATETALTTLEETTQTVESALESEFSETGALISEDFVTAIGTHETEVTKQAETLQTYISGECLSQLSDKSSEFSERLTQIADRLSQKLLEVSSNVEGTVTSSLDQAVSEHGTAIANLVSTAKDVSRALEDVGKTVDETSSNVTRILSLMETATDTTNKGFNTSVDVFMEAKELLGKFGMI
jgi:methyl-accepting chemotaxis protein